MDLDQREWLGLIGAGTVGLAAYVEFDGPEGLRGDPPLSQRMELGHDCISHCYETLHHCLEQIAQNQVEHARVARLLADCAEFCRLAADMIDRDSTLAAQACQACADACHACFFECERSVNPMIRACTGACHECEESCRSLLASMRSHAAPEGWR